jgi:hypothetical protein
MTTSQACCSRGREYAFHPWTFIWGEEIYGPFYPSECDHSRSQPPVGRLVRRAAAGAATSCVTPELGKCVVCKSSKVSSSDCVRLPAGSTKDPSLNLGSLERALRNLSDLGISSVELQKALQAFLEAFLTSFLKFR